MMACQQTAKKQRFSSRNELPGERREHVKRTETHWTTEREAGLAGETPNEGCTTQRETAQ